MEENFCKDCKYDQGKYYHLCFHPAVERCHEDYVRGHSVSRPDCSDVRFGRPKCELFEPKKSIWRRIYERLNSLANN